MKDQPFRAARPLSDFRQAASIAAFTLLFLGSVMAVPPTDVDISPEPSVIALNAPADTLIGTLSSTDPDLGDSHTYSLVPLTPQVIALPRQSDWSYFVTAATPGAGWETSGFDDSAWPSGPAELGYGDTTGGIPDEATLIGFGGDPDNRNITTYFRTTFNVDDASIVDNLIVNLRRDDGAVVYINGIEAFRDNMPAGAITPATPADTTAGGADETTFFLNNVDPASVNLQTGVNTVAVEVHQRSGTSSDVSFDLEIIEEITDPVDNTLFTIVGNELRSAVPNAGGEGAAYTVNVRSTDLASETFDQAFTILSTDNDAPSANNQNFSIDEGSAVGAIVGTIAAADPNGGDSLTFAITGGNTNASFAIHPDTGVLKVDEELGLDFEAIPSFTLQVSISDDGSTSLTTNIEVVVDVNDVNEAPVINGGVAGVQPFPPLNTVVGTFAATDPDLTDTLTYAIISGDANNVFDIDANGVITVVSPFSINPPATPAVYNLEVEATDDGGPALSSSTIVTIIVAETLVARNATGRYLVPGDGSTDTSWHDTGFDDSAWASGPGGFGYDAPAADPNYLGFIQTDVSAVMEDLSPTIYIRLPFDLADPSTIGSLALRIIYEDGFIAYLNGVEIASANTGPGPFTWQSAAAGNRAEGDVPTPSLIDVSDFKSELIAGDNLLAIHGLNVNATSSDFVIRAELVSSFVGTATNPLPPTISITNTDAVTQTGARVTGQIISGGAAPSVTLHWGATDGAQTPANWDNRAALGSLDNGEFVAFLESLDEGRTYFYTVEASNSAGTAWPAASETFATLPTATVNESILLLEDAASKTRVPTDGSEDAVWTGLLFDDSAWTSGFQGAGYDTGGTANYLPFISTDVTSELEDRQTSVYTRIIFAGPGEGQSFDRLRLLMRYDDAFVAYLNGQEILSVGAPENPDWRSFAAVEHEAPDDFDEFNVTGAMPLLIDDGPNVLAIHGMNRTLSSSDFIIQAQLIGDVFDTAGNQTLPSLQSLAPSAVTANSASANGEILSDGASASGTVETVFVYGTSDGGTNPLLWQNHVDAGPLAIGQFSELLANLGDNQAYFYNFYGYNERGIAWASTTQTFSTGTIVLPQTTTLAATNVLTTSAELNGTLDSNGGDLNTAIIFAWGTGDGGAVLGNWDNQLNVGANPEGALLQPAGGLLENTTYFYRIFAQNQAGIAAADDTVSFTTVIGVPVVVLTDPVMFGPNAAVLNGNLLSTGGADPNVSLYWGTSDGGTEPLAWTNEVDLGDRSAGTFTTSISGLTPGTQYFFSVKGQNIAGLSWASSMSFYAGQTVALTAGSPASYRVPADATDDAAWFAPDFDDSSWATGPTGIGYDENPDYDAYIGTDIDTEMNGVNSSVFVRVDFNVANPAAARGLVLRMRYDDGYVAYLNGVEVARQNGGTDPAPLAFDAIASAGRAPETLNDSFEDVNISGFIGQLVAGNNVLAIHGLNTSLTSSDFFVQPEILTLATAIPGDNYGSWIAAFPSLTGADAGELADPDCDMIPNVLEYAFGGDPTVASLTASGEPLLPEGTVVPDGGDDFIEVTYRRRIDYQARNIGFSGEISDNMTTWVLGNFVQQGTAVPSADGITEFVTIRTLDTVSTLGDKNYGRIRVNVTN